MPKLLTDCSPVVFSAKDPTPKKEKRRNLFHNSVLSHFPQRGYIRGVIYIYIYTLSGATHAARVIFEEKLGRDTRGVYRLIVWG